MSAERKKTKNKEVGKVEPRNKVAVKPAAEVEPKKREVEVERIVLPPEPKDNKPKAKAIEGKFIRIALDATNEERKIINERRLKGEIRLSYFAVDGNKGYHYYILLKELPE